MIWKFGCQDKESIEKYLQHSPNCFRKTKNVAHIKQQISSYKVSFEKASESVEVDFLVDTRPPRRTSSCCIQQFVGLYLKISPSEIGLDRPLIMDYGPWEDEQDSSVFIYALPLSSNRVLVEAPSLNTRVREEDFRSIQWSTSKPRLRRTCLLYTSDAADE